MADTIENFEKKKQFYFLFILISLLLHFLFFGLLPHLDFAPSAPKHEDTVVEIDPKLLEEMSKVQRQIVLTETVNNKTPTKDTKYLSEHDQAVEKETKAHKVDIFQKEQQKPGKVLSLKDLAPAQDFRKPPDPGEFEYKKYVKKEQEGAERGGSEAASNDYLKDVETGDKTLLNTKEFIYFTYYNRIRQRLEYAWNHKLRTTLTGYMHTGRHLATDKNYVTRLVVVLDGNGKIRGIKVLEESGARDLDDAAVEAFNRAGPFPNPPRGLIQKDGLIKIRWDFILQS